MAFLVPLPSSGVAEAVEQAPEASGCAEPSASWQVLCPCAAQTVWMVIHTYVNTRAAVLAAGSTYIHTPVQAGARAGSAACSRAGSAACSCRQDLQKEGLRCGQGWRTAAASASASSSAPAAYSASCALRSSANTSRAHSRTAPSTRSDAPLLPCAARNCICDSSRVHTSSSSPAGRAATFGGHTKLSGYPYYDMAVEELQVTRVYGVGPVHITLLAVPPAPGTSMLARGLAQCPPATAKHTAAGSIHGPHFWGLEPRRLTKLPSKTRRPPG